MTTGPWTNFRIARYAAAKRAASVASPPGTGVPSEDGAICPRPLAGGAWTLEALS